MSLLQKNKPRTRISNKTGLYVAGRVLAHTGFMRPLLRPLCSKANFSSAQLEGLVQWRRLQVTQIYLLFVFAVTCVHGVPEAC